MENVIFDRGTLKVVGVNRPPLPFEVAIDRVSIQPNAVKSVDYTDFEQKTDEDGNGLYLLPKEPVEVEVTVGVERTKSTEPSEAPVMVPVQKPLLDEEGNHMEYEVIYTSVTPAEYDEEGELIKEETSEEVNSGVFHKLYVTVEEQEEDDEGNPLYWHSKEVKGTAFEARGDAEITKDDERFHEGLEAAMVEVVKSRMVTFEEEMSAFGYEDIAKIKEAGLPTGTFYDRALLYEDPSTAIDASKVSQVDTGFGVVRIPPGGAAVTKGIQLSDAVQRVSVYTEESAMQGLTIEVGDSPTTLLAANQSNEVKLPTEASEVFVKFTNPTDKAIELHAFAVLY